MIPPHLRTRRERLWLHSLLVFWTASAIACASGSGGALTPAQAASSSPPRAVSDDRAIIHVLNRIGFGPRPGEVDKVRQMGVSVYIDQQLHPERIPDAALDGRLAQFATLGLSSREIASQYFLPAQAERRRRQRLASASAAQPSKEAATSVADQKQGPAGAGPQAAATSAPEPDVFRKERQVLVELSGQRILRAVYSERQLQEVLVDFWLNHFNVFAGKGADRVYLTEFERDVIRPRVLGRFRDLLGQVAESPAMLFYLDNWMSVGPNTVLVGPRGPGAGIGRRVGAQGAPQRQRARAGLNENYARELMELHTLGVDGGYSQEDVREVARAFTGWTIAAPNQGGGFRFDERRHDTGQKLVLGHKIKAGGGKSDGEQVLDILSRHPSTARCIATKLARRLVADDPPKALVERAADTFRRTDGDLREVVRTIVTSTEFLAADGAKFKTPFEFVASALRATSAEVHAVAPSVQALRTLGMPLYFCQPPTGYADTSDAWMNAGALLARMNFAVALANNRLPGVEIDLPALVGTGAVGETRTALVHALFGAEPADATLAVIAKGTSAPQVVALALGSPDFQKR